MKHKTLYKFIGQTILYFAIFLALLYFFSYLGQGQGGFIYNEFQKRRLLAESNQPITDMIETIERYAQLQPDYPVYNVLGEEHTYGQLKADSDSLAAHIDQMGLPEKSPVVVFGGQEYEML